MSQLTESSDDSLGSDGDDVWLREMRKKKKKVMIEKLQLFNATHFRANEIQMPKK